MNYDNTIFEENNSFLRINKRPRLLNILLLLSSIYILSTLTAVTQKLIDGPMTQIQLEEQMAKLYGSTSVLLAEGAGHEYIKSTEQIVENSIYINNEIFYLSNISLAATLVIGLISVYLMFFGFKIGLCFYLIYSILPIVTMYLTTPSSLILDTSVLILALWSAVLMLLYTIGFNKLDALKTSNSY